MKKLNRIMVINDMSGFGKCALTVAIPLINACGAEAVPVPTSILSSNMKFPGFYRRDLDGDTAPYLEHYNEMELCADAYYSGFICSIKQADALHRYLSDKKGIKLCDPIMGDNMRRYKGFDDMLCCCIEELCRGSDIITPNPTEAYILTGEEMTGDLSCDKMRELAEKLKDKGPGTVVITGVVREGSIFNCVCDKDGYREHESELLHYMMSGTGDMFASLLISFLTLGRGIDEAVRKAQSFISFVMRESREYEDWESRGPCFEPYLHMLSPANLLRANNDI